MFPTQEMIEKVLDGVDLAIDFATLGEYGLIPAGQDERLMRATGAMPLAEVISLDSRRKVQIPAPAVAAPARRVAPVTAAGARLAISPGPAVQVPAVRPAETSVAVVQEAQADSAPCAGADRRRQAPPAKDRAASGAHASRRRGAQGKLPGRDQLTLELSA